MSTLLLFRSVYGNIELTTREDKEMYAALEDWQDWFGCDVTLETVLEDGSTVEECIDAGLTPGEYLESISQ